MKKLDQQGFHHVLMVVIIVVVVAVLGSAGWYVWDKNKTDNSANVATPTPTPGVTATTTPTPTAVVATENELDTLRTFCQGTDPDTLVGSIQYVENSNGKFASCGIGSKTDMGGGMLIAVYQDGAWNKIWEGNGIMDNSTCYEYKIPTSIYTDCSDYYN